MSARRSGGVIMIASGSIGMLIGFILTGTGIGAICGLPMILVCIIMIIWGYLMKAKDQAIRDDRVAERMLQTQAIASGVNICQRCKTPNPNTFQTCSACGAEFPRIGDPGPISAVDPAELTLITKQSHHKETVFEPEDN